MKFAIKAIVGIATVISSGCAYSIHEVQVSDFRPYVSPSKGTLVKASGEQFVVLGFVGQTDYINQAHRQLQRACPGGYVTGITTQLSTDLGFFSWTNRVLMQGLCVHASKSEKTAQL